MAGGVTAFVRMGSPLRPISLDTQIHQALFKLASDIEITLVTVPRNDVYASLMQGRLDVSIIDDGMVPSGVAKLPLFRDDLIAIMATGHPLAGRKISTPKTSRPTTW
jgi:LysR family transcriptional regulator for metE and metH